MVPKKKPIPLRAEEDSLLRKLYRQYRVPRGQLKSHPDLLAEFTDAWNGLSGRADAAGDLLHYIDTQQKKTSRLPEPWPVFNNAHKRLPHAIVNVSVEQMDVLRELYVQHIIPLRLGTDSLAYRDDLLALLEREFTKRTGNHVRGMLLAAKIEQKRKDGLWPRVQDHVADDDLGFSDLDLVG